MSACYNRLHDYEQVQKEAEKMIELDPQQAKGYVRRGGAAFFQGKFEEANSDYDKGTLT